MAKQQASLTLDNIGRSVRAGLALALPEEPAVRAGRARFIATVHLAPRRSWRWVYGVVAGAAAAAGLLVWFAWQSPPASGFMAAGAPGRLGAMLRSGEAVVPVRFAEGSAIDLDPQSQLQVARFDPEQAHVRLTHGRAHLSIHKKGRRTWALDAGPFRVNVTGTRFSVDWQPQEKRMEVLLHEGTVVVSGPCLAQARRMIAPDRVVVRCVSTAQTVAPVAEAPPTRETPTSKASAAHVEVRERSAAALPLPAAPPVPQPHALSWEVLVAQGRYKEALQEANRQGLARICRQAPVAQLQDLADAARFAGDADYAERVLQSLRSRFAGTPHAALASFHLGRLAFDQQGRHASAAAHFSRYLQEQPQGHLVGDAWGRLLEARMLLPHDGRAHADARDYLSRFPNGPYARLARRLLQRESP